jgi:dTDP-4-dehydrorhamnose 3,5-epimerase
MPLTCEPTPLPGVRLFTPEIFADPRGFFTELFHADKYRDHGFDRPVVQSNFSRSCRGILRGLHYQLARPQAKLIVALAGEIFDVAVDIRRGSPTFGRWFGTVLSETNHRQMFVPRGFAHGFCVLSAQADVMYSCDAPYDPADEYGLAWNDPGLGIAWPINTPPLLSGRDQRHPALKDAAADHLPVFAG